MPSSTPTADPVLVPAVYAHRGCPDASRGIAENTTEAFARARELGADGVELDVRRTADGALAVHHDPELPGLGPLCQLRVADLPEAVPLLADALAACGDLVVNVEIKNLPTDVDFDPDEQVARLVADTVADCRDEGTTVVSSFWLPSLDAVRRRHPTLATGLLLASWADPSAGIELAADAGCRAVHLPVALVRSDTVAAAHGAGLAVAAWTVNDADDLDRMRRLGVETVITDRVDLAVSQRDVPR
ncbi:MAG: glycerophosphodiester phosphodiesterase [Acidimicrobiales bacterium]